MQPGTERMVAPDLLIWMVLPPERQAAVVALLAMLAARAAGRTAGGGRDEPGRLPAARAAAAEDPPGAPGPGCADSFGVVGERAGQDGCGVWQTSLTHRNPESGARSACPGLAGVSQRGGPAVDLIHEFPVHLPGGVEVVRQLTGAGLELADLLA